MLTPFSKENMERGINEGRIETNFQREQTNPDPQNAETTKIDKGILAIWFKLPVKKISPKVK